MTKTQASKKSGHHVGWIGEIGKHLVYVFALLVNLFYKLLYICVCVFVCFVHIQYATWTYDLWIWLGLRDGFKKVPNINGNPKIMWNREVQQS
jgi:hypothetical protein